MPLSIRLKSSIHILNKCSESLWELSRDDSDDLIWSEARQFCKKRGMNVLSLQGEDDIKRLDKLVRKYWD